MVGVAAGHLIGCTAENSVHPS